MSTPIDFPNSPTINQIFSVAGKDWKWDGTVWQLIGAPAPPDSVLKSTVEAKGDLIVGTGAASVSKLGIGTNGQVLTASSSASGGMVWSDQISSIEAQISSIEAQISSIEAIAMLGL